MHTTDPNEAFGMGYETGMHDKEQEIREAVDKTRQAVEDGHLNEDDFMTDVLRYLDIW